MYEVYVGIDFGSPNSGFAYSFKDTENINHGNIYGANVDNKVPTEIILDDNNEVLQFGASCIQYLKEKGLKAGHCFKGIKMNLYMKNEKIKSKNSNKELPFKLVISKVLETIKEMALKEIELKRPFLKENKDKIKWIVTYQLYSQNMKKIL